MRNIAITFLPVLLGVASVFQAGLNEKIFKYLGIAATTALNSVVVFVTSAVIWAALRVCSTDMPQKFTDSPHQAGLTWWFLLPGVLGFLLVAGIPFSISKLGASRAILVLVITQIIAGIAWECVVERRAPQSREIFGSLIAVAGVWIGKADPNGN